MGNVQIDCTFAIIKMYFILLFIVTGETQQNLEGTRLEVSIFRISINNFGCVRM